MNTTTDAMNAAAMSTPLRRRLRARFDPAGDGGWYCYDNRTYDGTNECGHGKTKADALADLIEKREDR